MRGPLREASRDLGEGTQGGGPGRPRAERCRCGWGWRERTFMGTARHRLEVRERPVERPAETKGEAGR